MASITAGIFETAAKFPDATAIEVVRAGGIDQTTFGELVERANHCSGWLVARGTKPGDRVAILADNDAAWIAVYLGTLRIGAVAVPLDTAYASKQVAAILESSGARLIVTTPRYLATALEGVKRGGGSGPRVALMSGAAPDTETIDW